MGKHGFILWFGVFVSFGTGIQSTFKKKKKTSQEKKLAPSWFKASMHPALATMETWPVSLS